MAEVLPWSDAALTCGALRAADINKRDIKFYPDFPEMCRSNACGFYGANWACPPGCGDSDLLFEKITGHKALVLFQHDYPLNGMFDINGMQGASGEFSALCRKIRGAYKRLYGDAEIYGAGPCALCPECTYPKNPCRFLGELIYPLEACGINVSELCQAVGLPYDLGEDTVTFTGLIGIK